MIRGFIITCLACLSLSAQTFEAASIKPAAPIQGGRIMIGMRGGPDSPEPGQITFTNVSIGDIVQSAYDVKSYQVTGPGWLESARFDVLAKVPAGTTKAQSRIMLQNMLAERFHLVLHRSTKEAPIYAMVVARNGPKLKESVEDPNAPADVPITPGKPIGSVRGGMTMMMAPGGRMRMVANGAPIAKLIDALGMQLDRPIVDMTGLKGTYDITLEFAQDPAMMRAKMAAMGVAMPPGPGPEAGGASASADADAPATIFSALPDQLGLRLEARKGPVELLVIDSADKTPTDN